MKQLNLGFVGAGNMASSLIAGLCADGYDPDKICASDVDAEKLDSLASRFGIKTSSNNQAVAENSQILVLAVKP